MSAFENVLKLVKEWTPATLPTELKYRDSLAALLRERLGDAKVETEYRHCGTTTDIYVKQSGFFGSSEVFLGAQAERATQGAARPPRRPD
jgi:hypothetical protein